MVDTTPVGEVQSDRTRPISAKLMGSSIHELARFGIAGLAATASYFIMANSFAYFLSLAPQRASALAYLISIGVSYLLQSRFTFRKNCDEAGQLRRFVLASTFGLFLSFAIVKFTEDVLNWPLMVASVLVCVAIPVSNYLLMKIWVFK